MAETDKELAKLTDWLQANCAGAELFSDSRDIGENTPNAVFFGYVGDADAADGRDYIKAAVKNGAKAVVYESEGYTLPEIGVPSLGVKGLKALAGPAAARFYGAASRDMKVIAVTGTNGKTSCAQWLGDCFSRIEGKAAVIGTLGVTVIENGTPGKSEKTGYTTPDQIQLQRFLNKLAKAGIRTVALEASSIGIDQMRLNGLAIDTVLFTNFTRDHLDYHGSMESYRACKRSLFDWPGLKHAVMNVDDETGLAFAKEIAGKLDVSGYTTGETSPLPAMLRASRVRFRGNKTVFELDTPEGSAHVKTHLVGQFNVSNVLGVIGVLRAQGIPPEKAVSLVGNITPPAGRMQMTGGINAPLVVIDYAHTPDALEKGLETLRGVADARKGKLWCVFGCGGDRDPGKRPQMGHVSEAADSVIVTSDNPRSEDPYAIMDSIVAGMKTKPRTIEDRAVAILTAVREAADEDVILLAGKGHETTQEIKGVKLPFEDCVHARIALSARAGSSDK